MDGLLQCIIAAKKSSYAQEGNTQTIIPLLPGTRQLEYRSGDYFYRDIYAGMTSFSGQEIVYYQENPVWSMSYAGGLLAETDKAEIINIYSTLREALRLVDISNPFRGPKEYFHTPYSYTNVTTGTLNRFNGHEVISNDQSNLYELFYSGGMVR